MITRLSLSAAALVLLVSLATAAARQAATTTSSDKTAAQNGPADPAYVIGADDVLNISVWKDPELTQTVPVRPDGKISMPLLNDIQAAGRTPNELKAQITEGLKKYITDPVVTVIVTQINSQRVYITGEVTRPGALQLLPGMTILQALSSAGGFTNFANTRKIYMFRIVNGKQVDFPFDYKDVIHGKKTDENVVLQAGDTIVVP
ncbi:MAG TPA: polysaccharide biosynthesis/export family protein [Terriglobales bacterium]|nr:polysaccharide biosynthesis/export family protein [Terriglobales bacterium]